MNASAQYLSPAEAAKRLGVSAKALRLYEQRGLVAPLRTAADWRTYGPEQMARLHQVIALKRMGLSLAHIAELLSGHAGTLSAVLALQEQVLASESARLSRALELVRAARARLVKGEILSVDDLTTLTKETTMTTKLNATGEEMKAIFDPLIAKHFTPSQVADMHARADEFVDDRRGWAALIEEAKALMKKGDPISPAALDLARRWGEQVRKFSHGDRDVELRMTKVWKDAMADPAAAPKLPFNNEIWGFVAKAMTELKDMGE